MPDLLIHGNTRPAQIEWLGHPVKLSPAQFRFLEILAREPRHIVSFDTIYAGMYAQGEIVEPAMVQWHKSTLVAHILKVTGNLLPIKHFTRRGYMLDVPRDQIIWAQEATNARQTAQNHG